MKKIALLMLLTICVNLFAHFSIYVDTDESKGLISNVTFAPLQIGVGFFDKWQLYDGKVHSFVSLGLLGLLQESAILSAAPVSGIKNNFSLAYSHQRTVCTTFKNSNISPLTGNNFAAIGKTHTGCRIQ